ncbi:glycosyltransferase involved in cell wall biosynthesis [Pseudoduganella flava]|uniref:Glycosyltransferase n=1 Tax=Pseudoduganella flava TaxID=871742 RepID=A0A562Q4X0_9BURK|nr:glycosyltransferase [Pseudoduganella flava]QGZ41787.1 glycosyltransferase [Pseudoduganella flava]TWI51791.1 glycosyltransferase involved in cell wall biosynthesis [Pseudoduganella flava]
MLCSVVMPVYNKAEFVEFAIRSVLEQTHADLELIVVDDGSTDHSAEVIKKIEDSRLRLIQQPNGGVSRARNRGIEAATGELISFLDADDWYGPFYLEAIVAMATQLPDHHYFSTHFRWTRDYEPEVWAQPLPTPLPYEVVMDFFERRRRNGKLWNTNTIAVRRTVLQSMQPCFPVGESHGEDQDLWFRLAERHRLVYCPLPLVGYRMEVLGSLNSRQAKRELMPAFVRLEQRALQGQITGTERRAALRMVADLRAGIARDHLVAGNRSAALSELWRARRACSSHWTISVLMSLVFSSGMARRWQEWRKSREPERRISK